mmetsp:Transcript_8564/g.27168  ORF Transcript_8564/g.27168 Transcript_8564/m.27168 type:complete len:239 (+) Transcript_8564:780-1496(+)
MARGLEDAAVPRRPHGFGVPRPVRDGRGPLQAAARRGVRAAVGPRALGFAAPGPRGPPRAAGEGVQGPVLLRDVQLRDDVAAQGRPVLGGPRGPPARPQRLEDAAPVAARRRHHEPGPDEVPLQGREAVFGRQREVALGLLQRAQRPGRRPDRLLRRLPVPEVRRVRAHRREPGGGHGQADDLARVEDVGHRVRVLLDDAQRRRGRQRHRLPRHVRRPPDLPDAPHLELRGALMHMRV